MSEFEGQEKLEELRKKDPGAHTAADREYLASRRSYLTSDELAAFGIAEDVAPVVEAPKIKPSKGLTVAQLQEALTAKGVEFAEDAKRPHLAALFDEVSDEEEEEQE